MRLTATVGFDGVELLYEVILLLINQTKVLAEGRISDCSEGFLNHQSSVCAFMEATC